MEITGCRVNYGSSAKKELFELLPRSIERMINGNVGQSFDFRISLSINGRNTSAVKSFGPDFEETDDFEMLKGKTIPVTGNRKVVAFGLKFNEDGTINVVSADEIPSNEGALPRESTVKQLEKIRKATKSTTIDDRVPKLKGANLGSEKNFVDSGIESYEDFQKKNKSFVPSWNLKHLKSPFKNESFRNSLSDKVPGLVSSEDGKRFVRDILSKLNDKNFLNSIKVDDYRMPSKFTIKTGNDVYVVIKSSSGPPNYGFRDMIGMEVNVDYDVLKNGKYFSDSDDKIFTVSNRDAKNLFYSLEKRLRSK
jgi:hypothetical protein